VRFRSLRARLTLWYSGLLAVTFLLLGGAGYGLLGYTVSRDLDAALLGVGQALADQVRADAKAFPRNVDEAFRRFFGFSPWDRYVEMLDPAGHPDPRRPSERSEKLPLSPHARKNALEGRHTLETVEGLGTHPVRVLTQPVMEGARVISLVQVGMSLERMMETQRNFLLTLAAVLPLGLLLAGGGGWLLARRALGPVVRMAETAHRIGAAHLATRIQEPGTGDELDRLARTLNEMFARLDAAFIQSRQFTADASHELQTPLTILKGELEVALRSPRSAEIYQQVLGSALEEVNRIARMVDGLLILSRADAGALRMARDPVDLPLLVEEVHAQALVLAQGRSVSLCLGGLEPVGILGDADGLRRVLLNLVDNAIKYTPPGGRITLTLEQGGAWATLRISDTGVGIQAGDREAVFRRFFRTQEARDSGEPGVGLGLCISRSIVEAHGGKLEVESAPGRGTTFTVLLPLAT
jgi:two-component system, OmpR family, sensor kinase